MSTNYKGSKKELRALNTYIKLQRAAESTRSRINTGIKVHNLTDSQLLALDALYFIGSLNQKQLGNKIRRSEGNITMVVDNLEKHGLVLRERGKEDRRKYFVRITTKGSKLFESFFPKLLKSIVDEMGKLSSGEQEQLQQFCKIIGYVNK